MQLKYYFFPSIANIDTAQGIFFRLSIVLKKMMEIEKRYAMC